MTRLFNEPADFADELIEGFRRRPRPLGEARAPAAWSATPEPTPDRWRS